MATTEEKLKELRRMLDEATRRNAEAEQKLQETREKLAKVTAENKKLKKRLAALNDVTTAIYAVCIDRIRAIDAQLDPEGAREELKRIIVETNITLLDRSLVNGLAKYLARKSSEKTDKLFPTSDPEAMAAKAGKEAEDKNRSIKMQEQQHANALNACGKGAIEAAQTPEGTNDEIIQAAAGIAGEKLPPQSEEEKRRNRGRLKPTEKNRLEAEGAKAAGKYPTEWKCPNCNKTVELDPNGSEWLADRKAFLRSCAELLVDEEIIHYPVYRCTCGQVHVNLPEDLPIPYSPAPGCHYASDIVISVGVAMSRGIAGNAFENLLNIDNQQIGTSAIARAVHAMGREETIGEKRLIGALARLVEKHREEARKAAVLVVDEKPIEIRQHNGKSQKQTESKSQQGYVVSTTNGPGVDRKFELYYPIDGRGAEELRRIISPHACERLMTDGYRAYWTVLKTINEAREAAEQPLPPLAHANCLTHWRRELLTCLNVESMNEVLRKGDAFEVAKRMILKKTPEYLICTVIDGMRKIYAHEEQVRRSNDESYEDYVARVKANRDAHARQLMDHIDTIMLGMQERYAALDKGLYVAANDSPIAKAVVYYMNNRDGLRMFLDDGRLPPDTNDCERSIRPIAVYLNACGAKQSFEYARSYCNWLSLDRTARANGIKSTTRWLNEFFRAFTQHCLDWTLSKRSDESSTDSVNIQRYDEGAYAEFDFEPWLAWNWKPAADC